MRPHSFLLAVRSRSAHRTTRIAKHPHRRPAFRANLESLEPRLVLNGVSPIDIGPPIAVENTYATDEDTVLAGNVITDDTGSGSDSADAPGIPLIVTAVNGETLEAGVPIVLDSGARLTMAPDGSFAYDPQTSATLSSLPAGGAGTDTFSYTVSHGFGDIISFGDSLSDVGRLLEIVGEELFDPVPGTRRVNRPERMATTSAGLRWSDDDLRRLVQLTRTQDFASGQKRTQRGQAVRCCQASNASIIFCLRAR